MEIRRFINDKPAQSTDLQKTVIPNQTVYRVLRQARRREENHER